MINKAYSAILILFFYFTFSELIVAAMLLHNNTYLYIAIYLCAFISAIFALKVYVKMPIYFIVFLLVLFWGGFSFVQLEHAQGHYSVDMQANRVKSDLLLVKGYVKSYMNLNDKCPNSLKEALNEEDIKDPFTNKDYIIMPNQQGCLIRSLGPNKLIDNQYVNVENDALPNYRGGSVWHKLYTNKLLLSIDPSLGNENIDLAIMVTGTVTD